MVTVKSRITRLRTAAAGIALITSALVLSAGASAQAQTVAHAPQIRHTATVSPRFTILCSGDVCVQTVTKGATIATVNAWADTVSFTGHFELLNGCGQFVANSPDQFWPSGRSPHKFTGIHWADCMDQWKVIGWQENSPGDYSRVGTVNFTI